MSEVCEIGGVRHLYDTETHLCIRCGINEPTAPPAEQRPSKEKVAQLRDLRVRLKTGEYSGTDVMQAWIVLGEYADEIERTAHEPKAPASNQDFVVFAMGDGSLVMRAEDGDDIVRVTIQYGNEPHNWYYLDREEATKFRDFLNGWLSDAEEVRGASNEPKAPASNSLLTEAADIIRELIDGGCDHSVGICYCREIGVMEALRAAAEPKPIRTSLEDSWDAVLARTAEPPSASRFYGVPRDVPIWICSVCNGWNHVQDERCTNTHAVTKGEGP